jgi:hypothetical protein
VHDSQLPHASVNLQSDETEHVLTQQRRSTKKVNKEDANREGLLLLLLAFLALLSMACWLALRRCSPLASSALRPRDLSCPCTDQQVTGEMPNKDLLVAQTTKAVQTSMTYPEG